MSLCFEKAFLHDPGFATGAGLAVRLIDRDFMIQMRAYHRIRDQKGIKKAFRARDWKEIYKLFLNACDTCWLHRYMSGAEEGLVAEDLHQEAAPQASDIKEIIERFGDVIRIMGLPVDGKPIIENFDAINRHALCLNDPAQAGKGRFRPKVVVHTSSRKKSCSSKPQEAKPEQHVPPYIRKKAQGIEKRHYILANSIMKLSFEHGEFPLSSLKFDYAFEIKGWEDWTEWILKDPAYENHLTNAGILDVVKVNKKFPIVNFREFSTDIWRAVLTRWSDRSPLEFDASGVGSLDLELSNAEQDLQKQICFFRLWLTRYVLSGAPDDGFSQLVPLAINLSKGMFSLVYTMTQSV
ncbi:hypothetical protein COLO4_06972 [Corchorus olitorius]|uniref:Aminotransferase-like plant mobile domain-containing protein n=1 Tax=Corchorus olitorius TaxID=93759 RepID=A0A1R3KLK2_9ROSI|nr:hypothetical protein COLO4_06972 [Corchorus olitorius]